MSKKPTMKLNENDVIRKSKSLRIKEINSEIEKCLLLDQVVQMELINERNQLIDTLMDL